MKTLSLAFLISLLAVSTSGFSQGHSGHSGHGGQAAASAGIQPTSPGQEAFGAIAEIIALLEADPATDWSKVDIPALQAHLQDMQDLVMLRRIKSRPIDGGLQMDVPLQGPGGSAAGRMLPAHGPVLAAETGWQSELLRDGEQLVWTVIADRPADVVKLRALGFIGLMATGWHHQAHHLAIARGTSRH